MSKTQIGWFVLKEDKEFYNEFETAAWFEKVLVKAGRYPVEAYDVEFYSNGKMGSHIGGAYVQMEGTIISDNFQSLFCGVPIGSTYDGTKNAGKPAHHSDFWYLYSVAESVATREKPKGWLEGDGYFELFPEYEARESSRYINDWDGSEHVLYGIYRKEA